MLQKLKVTSYVFIYFLMFGFSFIALQVTTEEVEAAGVCQPIDVIRNLKGTARDPDYKLWVSRCQISGQKGNCGVAGTHWPQGDSGRCEMTTADQEIVECKVAVYAVFNELRSCMQQAMATPPVPNGDYDKAWEGVIACTNSLPRDYVGTVMEPYWYT